jgi:hypothetical protein
MKLLYLLGTVFAREVLFVFEVLRHGARAPVHEEYGVFGVGRGMLSASGMR